MSFNGFELRITRSAKQPFSRFPRRASVSPPKSFAAFAVAHCSPLHGREPGLFHQLEFTEEGGPVNGSDVPRISSPAMVMYD